MGHLLCTVVMVTPSNHRGGCSVVMKLNFRYFSSIALEKTRMVIFGKYDTELPSHSMNSLNALGDSRSGISMPHEL